MRHVRANGLEIWLETAGSGPPLLFIGGTGWDLRRTRDPLGPLLTRHFSVALYDQRGQGQSAKPPGPYAMQDFAQDAVGVLDALGWERAHVVGYSFGGMVAQELAIRHPSRIDRLVLAATTSGGAGGRSYPIEEFVDLPPVQRARKGLEIADLRFAALLMSDPDKAHALIDARARNQTRFLHEPRAREGLTEQLRARAAHNTYDRLGAISAETLLVAGEFDGQAPMRAVEALAKRIPSSVFHTVPGAHDFIAENKRFLDLIVSFLAQR